MSIWILSVTINCLINFCGCLAQKTGCHGMGMRCQRGWGFPNLGHAESFWILKSQHLYSRTCMWRWWWQCWWGGGSDDTDDGSGDDFRFAQNFSLIELILTRFSFNGSWINHSHEIRPFCVNNSHNSLVLEIAFIGFRSVPFVFAIHASILLSFWWKPCWCWNNFSGFTRCVGSITKINVKQCTTSIYSL